MILIISLLFTTGLQASRNSSDILTATNALFNNYIQDVIGNKNDKNYGTSLVSHMKTMLTNGKGITNLAYTNIFLGRTNANRNTLIQSDGVTNETLLRIIDTVVDTNEQIGRTNRNRIVIIDTAVDNAVSIGGVTTNKLVTIDGVVATNERIGRTNRNRIVLIDTVVDNIESISGVITNIVRTNEARTLVPGVDSAANLSMRDVIGNKTDTHDGNSIYAIIEGLDDYIHAPSKVYPTLAVGSNTVTPGTVWTLTNNYTNELIPASTIAVDFTIHYLSIEALGGNNVYEIVLYNLTTGTEIGRVRVTKNAAQDGIANVPFQTPIQAANSRIGWRVASDGVSETITISIMYHEQN